jgi:hypothetical protein
MVFTKTGGGAFLPAEVQTVAKTLAFGIPIFEILHKKHNSHSNQNTSEIQKSLPT